jgi:hypothetical protein
VGYFLWLICTWESLALALQKFGINAIPTITQTITPFRDHGPWLAMAVGAFNAWVFWHLLVEVFLPPSP